MADGFQELIRGWGGLAVVTSYDPPSGAWIFIALHDDTLGVPAGGCRMRVYPSPVEGLRDALRLSEGMTSKWASIELPFGGGKSVLALSRPLEGPDREGFLRRFAGLLSSLHGSYRTGEDLGTTPADMVFLSELTDAVVVARDPAGAPVDPGPYTALGVFEGIRSALRATSGTDALRGVRVVVQGVGDVGAPLSRMIAEAGGTVMTCDLDGDRAGAVATEVGGTVVAPSDLYETDCDVYAPCAVGATLNQKTIPGLRCRIVAGSANNQLAEDEDAQRLHARGILYAPDYVINAGGALALGLMSQGVHDPDELRSRIRSLGRMLDEIFQEAGRTGSSPVRAATARVRRVLDRARGNGSGRSVHV